MEFDEATEVKEDAQIELTQWDNPPSIRDLKQDYEDARNDAQIHIADIARWRDNFNVEGVAKVKTPDGNSNIQPKLIRKQAEWRYPALSEPFLSSPDIFKVQPAGHMDREAAWQNQLILSYQFNNEIDKVAFIDEYVRTAVEDGTVIVRVGWDYQEEAVQVERPIVEYRPVQSQVEMDELQQVAAMVQQNAQGSAQIPEEMREAVQLSLQNGQPVYPEITGSEVVEEVQVVKNQPALEVCHYENVTIDPSCQGKIEDARFVVYSFETSKAELQADGKYSNLDQIMLDQNSPLGQPDQHGELSSFNFNDEPRKRIVAYEYWGYWDINGDGTLQPIVATWVGGTMIRMETNPFPDQKIPFVLVKYLPKRRAIYGEPDGALLEDNQKVIGAVTRGMIDLMAKSANSQTGVRKDALDLTNRRKFLQGKDYEFNANVDPRQAVYMHQFPEIPASAFNMLMLQNQEAESLTGVKAFNSGISGESLGEVAAGVRGALDASSKREVSILRRLANGMIQIGKKIISMNAEFLDDETIIRITDEESIAISREKLAGKFDLKLSISTAEEDNQKAQELAFMLQTMGNNMAPEMSQLILSEIARLRKMPDLAKQIQNYQPQPDPFEQQMKMLELQKLQAEIAELQGRAMEHQSGAQLDVAKAQNLGSDTDLKNLNFVEQESGVTQERELQKQSEQAKANAKRDMLVHSLKAREEANKAKSQN